VVFIIDAAEKQQRGDHQKEQPVAGRQGKNALLGQTLLPRRRHAPGQPLPVAALYLRPRGGQHQGTTGTASSRRPAAPRAAPPATGCRRCSHTGTSTAWMSSGIT